MKIHYKAGYKYQLVEGFSIQTKIVPAPLLKGIENRYLLLTNKGVLVIRTGYAWDGPSGLAIDSKTYMRASLIHDAFYQLMREGLLSANWRKEADDFLYEICVRDGMLKIRAYIAYRAVRRLAAAWITKRKRKKVLEAG